MGVLLKRISLETWLEMVYGEDAPAIETARRWCRLGKIYPKPEKHGRAYFLSPDARYTEAPRLIDRVRAEATTTA